ncbi:MAG: glycoside hydrolase family 15 protein, partial [Gemmatimonadota bacterium]|nr:glycoside hydrolase family 15 protein [Gemmatimonadota bacterium]
FDYARAAHRVEATEEGICFVPELGPALRLRSTVPLQIADGDAIAEWTLPAGESATFVLEEARPGEASPASAPHYAADTFKATSNFWRRWIGRSSYRGLWRDEVHRSALVLKLLTSEKHGSVVAAPTFGLPEAVGGVRNWDYRYTWIRDASFTLYALIRLGMTEETEAFMRWIEARCAEPNPVGSPLQALYGLDGRHELPETTLDHLDGYLGSRPVRIGNAAHAQLQLDIYGALIDSVYLYDKYGQTIGYDSWCNVRNLVEWVCENWRQPDEGIWEVRGGRRQFVHSRLMCWAALDRAVRLARKRSLPAPLDRWLAVRDQIYESIWQEFWNPELGAFVQYPGAQSLDASVLLMPLLRFVSPTDPRWLSTLAAVGGTLMDDSLVYRYRTGSGADDGLPNGEGTFSICSFWYVECLSRSGDLQQARFLFEKMLSYANHVGLYAEELGPSGEHLGNFPQAFTHLALISAAYDLDRRLSGAGWEA